MSRINGKKIHNTLNITIMLPLTQRTQSQSEVSLKQYHSSTGSHTTICSKLAQLILRKGRNHADSQAHSQAGSQTYKCLEWRDREVGVGVEVRFGVEIGNNLK